MQQPIAAFSSGAVIAFQPTWMGPSAACNSALRLLLMGAVLSYAEAI